MKLRTRVTGTALMLSLSVFGLAACGSDDSGDDGSSSSDNSSESTDSGDSGDSGDKPSKDEVVKGYEGMVSELLGDTEMPGDILNKVVTCFVDEVYDDATPQTLNAIAEGDQTGVDPADLELFTDASTTCQQAALQ